MVDFAVFQNQKSVSEADLKVLCEPSTLHCSLSLLSLPSHPFPYPPLPPFHCFLPTPFTCCSLPLLSFPPSLFPPFHHFLPTPSPSLHSPFPSFFLTLPSLPLMTSSPPSHPAFTPPPIFSLTLPSFLFITSSPPPPLTCPSPTTLGLPSIFFKSTLLLEG